MIMTMLLTMIMGMMRRRGGGELVIAVAVAIMRMLITMLGHSPAQVMKSHRCVPFTVTFIKKASD